MSIEVTVPEKTQTQLARYLSAPLAAPIARPACRWKASAPLLQHLNELRIRLFKAFLALIVTTGISFAFSEQLIEYLARPSAGSKNLVSIELTENIAIFMKVSLLGGFVLGMPVIVYQILAFILPGLKRNERIWLLVMVPFATLLFAAGVAFTWFVMLPTAIPFLSRFHGHHHAGAP